MVKVYRAGTTHEVRGIQCEMAYVEPEVLKHKIAAGWVLQPEKIIVEEVIEMPAIETKDPEPVKPEMKTSRQNPKKIREAAKKAGIEDWEKARISTLKDKLDHK